MKNPQAILEVDFTHLGPAGDPRFTSCIRGGTIPRRDLTEGSRDLTVHQVQKYMRIYTESIRQQVEAR